MKSEPKPRKDNFKKYILFFSGVFINHEDIEEHIIECFYSSPEDVSPIFKNIKFIFESERNGMVIFESKEKQTLINKKLYEILSTDSITSYYVFVLDTMLSTYISNVVRDFIYNLNIDDDNILKFHQEPIKKIQINEDKLELDVILEKIDKEGVGSLTINEKNFLDNFQNKD